ncbi:hypothetical protein PN466_09665 [Roseofilum reptotaenium CS-1145]|uniref:Uncharacterized protein n=1 Tax=Roseofilum reptotaenium AO1-A TaxID=1925591 RepID=A0A1L9QMS6_9CYAN|nr:hypothetical protein [Roseofilum reptotaenium]MDB9517214.1 hypothetical protein [Roseofilum reptotaenium CS-1145]OJJ22746.1 hypothetical protein BI308_19030 [Roseofilum reptotaenium AO1-A]
MLFKFDASVCDFNLNVPYALFVDERIINPEESHYFSIERCLEMTEEIFPDLKHVYIELDDQSWAEYGGFKSINLNRNQFTIYLDQSREEPNIDINYKAIKINFECNDYKFKELCEILQKIMEGHEDKLNFTGL